MNESHDEREEEIRMKLVQDLSSQEALESKNQHAESISDVPEVAQILVQSWKTSFRKISKFSNPFKPVKEKEIRLLIERNENIDVYSLSNYFVIGALLVLLIVHVANMDIYPKVAYGISYALFLGFALIILSERRKQLSILRNQNRLREIILDLVGNRQWLMGIYESTPRPWREVFLGSPPKDLGGMARLVAFNLDWYLVRPSIHFRRVWVAGITALVIICAVFFGGGNGFLQSSFSGAGIYMFVFTLAYESWRKLTGLALLIQEANRIFPRSSFQVDGSEEL